MPHKFWDEAFLTAAYLINILPSRVINYSTPAELLLREKPDYKSLRIFGCACWPNLRPYDTPKLAFRSTRCVFLAIVLFIKVLSVLNLLLVGFTSHVMWFLMRTFFLSVSYILMLVLAYTKKFFYCHTIF
jgi:hypothetical protein